MGAAETRLRLKDAETIVVKVGTSTLTYENGEVNFTGMDRLARTISDLMNRDRNIVLVTSGAIGVGTSKLKLDAKPVSIPEKQAVAAVGQCALMHMYSKFFGEYGHIVGQILLTRDIMSDETCRRNVLNTFKTLLDKRILPIVNENDSVSVVEIKVGEKDTFSENDTLASIVAKIIKADLLIILSDTDGFYEGDPRKDNGSRMLSVIDKITPDIEKFAGSEGSRHGTGGMVSKLNAAKIATMSGVDVVMANGSEPDTILDIIAGKEVGTLFLAQ